jgi:hypothetical protein
VLWRKIRSTAYDLAVDVSCSQSAMGSLIVGLSGARIRAGCAGKWDRFFNLKIAKLAEVNKYRKLKRQIPQARSAKSAPDTPLRARAAPTIPRSQTIWRAPPSTSQQAPSPV